MPDSTREWRNAYRRVRGALLLGVGISMLGLAWAMLNGPGFWLFRSSSPNADGWADLTHLATGAAAAVKDNLDNVVHAARSALQHVNSTVAVQEKSDALAAAFARKNDEAAQRAVQSVKDKFDDFRGGIKPFAEDITSYGTRFHVMGRMAEEKWDKWWNKKDDSGRVKGYLDEKFRQHVLSEDKLQAAVTDAFTQYSTDMLANRNELLSQLAVVLSDKDVPEKLRINEHDLAPFVAQIQGRFGESIRGMGQQSVVEMILTLVASELGYNVVAEMTSGLAAGVASNLAAFVTADVTATLVPEVATSAGELVLAQTAARFAAPAAIAAGGAMATTTTAGSATGSVGGPVGTIVGFGAGMVIGIAIDWWMTERFQIKISGEVDDFLTALEGQLLDGNPVGRTVSPPCPRGLTDRATDAANSLVGRTVSPPSESNAGFKKIFEDSNRIVDKAMKEAVFDAMIAKVQK